MSHPDPLIAKLQTLQTQLPDLIGDQASAVSQQLTQILQAAEQNPQDETITTRINLLLRHHPAAQAWLAQQAATQQVAPDGVERTAKGASPESYGVTRGFEPLAGNPAPIPTDQYICPQCNTTYFRRGTTIPSCDRHQPAVTCIAMEHTP